MIVVADTSPINYLILIGEIDVLAALYGRVVIPLAVHDELTRSRAPLAVRSWITNHPHWIEVQVPVDVTDSSLSRFDAGERQAIALAQELSADQLIVDELLGRREAERRGISVIGTIGVLREAAENGLLDLRKAVESLSRTSFHISPAILAALLKDLH